MSINDRVREVRNTLSFTQNDFGQKLSIAQSYLTNIETGKREVTDKICKLICLTFNVNEEWLREGVGDMFVENDNFLLSSLSQQYGLDGLDRKIIEAYINLPDMQRGVIKGFVRNLVDSVLAEENYEEYREDYIKVKVAPIAARHGNIDGLQEAADLYDKAKEGDKDE